MLALLVTPRLVTGQAAETARSVVLFVGDGVDDHQLTIARNYLLGADGVFVFETFEHQAAAKAEMDELTRLGTDIKATLQSHSVRLRSLEQSRARFLGGFALISTLVAAALAVFANLF